MLQIIAVIEHGIAYFWLSTDKIKMNGNQYRQL